ANIIENEKVQIVNINNGERLETYVIRGQRGTGVICLNGPAARKVAVGDVVIIISYAQMDFEEAKTFNPWLFTKKSSNQPPTLVNPGIIPHINIIISPKEPSNESSAPFQVGFSFFLK
ncbi:MAG: aspartate 1-decarboxylase, partial [Proteiniphilum sp.]|nr:aspartate 1-decarboxylase [Proteiniphilum sp.]